MFQWRGTCVKESISLKCYQVSMIFMYIINKIDISVLLTVIEKPDQELLLSIRHHATLCAFNCIILNSNPKNSGGLDMS